MKEETKMTREELGKLQKKINKIHKEHNEEVKNVKEELKEVKEELKKAKEEIKMIMEEVGKMQKGLNKFQKEHNEELKKRGKEHNEEIKKGKEEIKMIKEELGKMKKGLNKFQKEHNEELKKIRKEHNEELKNVITEKNETLRVVMKDNDKKLEEKRCELEELEDTNSALIIKERQSTDELQEALTELIRGLRDLSSEGSMIRVKRMGEVDEKPFLKVCEQRFNGENVEVQHGMLCSKWQKALKDPAWYPFKRVGTGEKNEVVDDEDEELKKLNEEWGEDVKNAVKTALEELNPSGRCLVPVLWNFEHGRKATLKEGIAHMTHQIKNLKRKRT